MSQNSLILPTTGTVSGLTVVQDVNSALDTLNTLNSGTAAPSTTEGGMLWHDTTNNTLYIRNLANSAWIALGVVDETNGIWMPAIGGAAATNIASATTCDLWSVPQNVLTITGTTTITSLCGSSDSITGTMKFVTFGGALTLTYNATSLILPTSNNISTAAGDTAIVMSLGSGNVRVFNFERRSGAALATTAVVPYYSAAGCLPSSITGTHTTASMTVSAGQVADSTNAVFITSAGYSWAASNGNAINGTDAGSSTLANSTTYHMYLVSGASGVGTFASATYPASGVTFPTGYTTSARRIFSFNTDSSGNPIPYTAVEVEGGSILCWLATQTVDISIAAATSVSRTLYTLNVPASIKVEAFIRYFSAYASAFLLCTSPDETDVAPANGISTPLYDSIGTNSISHQAVTTNTSGQIGFRAYAGSTSLYEATRGWKDWRRS